MMSRIYSLLLLAALLWGAIRFFSYYQRVQRGGAAEVGFVEVKGEALPGLSLELAPGYAAARDSAVTLKRWLDQHQRSPDLQDPRKAWIQLDYVQMISLENPAEAKRLFAEIKQRVGPNSPVYARLRKLERTYE